MSENLSADVLAAMLAEETAVFEIWLLELDAVGWPGALRLASCDFEVEHGGDVFAPSSFKITPPAVGDDVAGITASLTIDNVDLEHVARMRGVEGSSIAARFTWVSSGDLETAQIGWIEGEISVINGDERQISASIMVEAVLDRPLCERRMDPANAPGLF